MSVEERAAWLELKQAQQDYRATWFVRPHNMSAEESAWDYTNSAYRAWADITNDV